MKNLVLFISIFFPLVAFGQIAVDPTVDEIQAMQTLLGENVTISDLQFTGTNDQIGTFTCMDCGLDFEEGVILATGSVETALGPNQAGGNTIGGSFNPGSDIDLDILNPNSAGDFNDIAVLEFDFVSLGDSVWFDYVFASDEYPEFSGSEFNDTFGFFMSGPGISGPYSNNSENLALIPGTDIGVTINNVNAGAAGTAQEGDPDCNNCEFYENNGTGQSGQPQFDDPNVMGYDGFTVGLRAIRGGLICGETYHLRIVIADAGDSSWDSAVFLKAGSLSSNLTVQVELQIEATNEDGVMNEECGLSTLTFSRPEAIDSSLPFTVNIVYSGDAENGVDYTLLPEVLVFDPGVDTIEFILDAFEDGEIEGLESVILDMQSVAVCEGESVPSTFEFYITESAPLEVAGFDVDICAGSSIEIAPIIVNGSGGFEYEWSTNETTAEITVDPGETTTYSVSISDTCLVSSAATDITVNVAQFPPLEISASPANIDVGCNWFGESIDLSAQGGDGSYSFEFSTNGGASTSFGSSFFVFDENSEIIGYVTDGCGVQEQVEVDLNLTIPALEFEIPDSIFTCPGEFTIEPIVSGGTAPYNFSWFDENFTFSTGPIYTGFATDDTAVTLNLSDGCGIGTNQSIPIIIQEPEDLVINAGADVFASCETNVNINGQIISGVAPFIISWETLNNQDLGDSENTSILAVQDETLIFSVSDNCGQAETDTLELILDDTPLEITLPTFLTGDCQTLFQLQAELNIDEVDVSLDWSGPPGFNLSSDNLVTYQSLETGVIEVFGDAGCGNTAEASTELIVLSPPISLDIAADTTICLDGIGILSAEASGGSGSLTYNWVEEGSSNAELVVSPSVETVYNLIVTDQCLNQKNDSMSIDVQNFDVTYTTESDEPYSFLFIPEITPQCLDCSYLWTFSDGAVSEEESPFYEFEAAGYVGAFLEVTSPIGCLAEYTDVLNVPPIAFIPNSFTPDNDGVNDAFFVSIEGIDLYELTIFNRWGEVVFQSQDPSEGWIGNNMNKGGEHFVSPGVYSYILKYRGLDSDSVTRLGNVTVVR